MRTYPLLFVIALATAVAGCRTTTVSSRTWTAAPQPWWMLPALVAAGLVAVAGLVSVGRNGRRSWAWAAGAFVLGIVLARTFGWASASDSGGGATGEW